MEGAQGPWILTLRSSQELRAFLTTVTKTQVMIDRSSDGAWLARREMSRLLSRRCGPPAATRGILVRSRPLCQATRCA